MDQRDLLRAQIEAAFSEIRQRIWQLSTTGEEPTRTWLLDRLWQNVLYLHGLMSAWGAPAPQYSAAVAGHPETAMAPGPGAQPVQLPALTPEQLATYTGRNGMPAYVAVNGVVYDMTNNKAWSAATHFGLTAGRDLTTQFSSCHLGQPGILGTLPSVGRLV